MNSTSEKSEIEDSIAIVASNKDGYMFSDSPSKVPSDESQSETLQDSKCQEETEPARIASPSLPKKEIIYKFDVPTVKTGFFTWRYDSKVSDMIKLTNVIDATLYANIVNGVNAEIDNQEHWKSLFLQGLIAVYILIVLVIGVASKNFTYTLELTLVWFIAVIALFSLVYPALVIKRGMRAYLKSLNVELERKNLVVKMRKQGLCSRPWSGVTLGVITQVQLNLA